MERIIDEATLTKVKEGEYRSRLVVEEKLTAEDVVTVESSLNSAIANLEGQIKQGKDQMKQIKSQIPLLEKKIEEMKERLRKAKHLFVEAKGLVKTEESNEESSETTKDD